MKPCMPGDREREREREREATPNKLKSILDRAACGFRAIDVAKRAGFGRAYRGTQGRLSDAWYRVR